MWEYGKPFGGHPLSENIEIEWEDPGKTRGRRRMDWKRVADQLREHPGRWARMPGTFSHSIPGFIKAGRMKPFQPAGTFEATMRGGKRDGDGEGVRGQLYVRFIGEDTDLEWGDPPAT